MFDQLAEEISIAEANSIGLSKVLRKAEEKLIFLTKRDRPVLLVQGFSSKGMASGLALAYEVRDQAYEEGEPQMGNQAEEYGAWMHQMMSEKEEIEAQIQEDPMAPKVSVSEANRQGISWIVQTAEEEGMLFITRHGDVAALLMPFTLEGIRRYEERLREIASYREEAAYNQLRREMREVRELRHAADRARYQLLPQAREIHEQAGSEEEPPEENDRSSSENRT